MKHQKQKNQIDRKQLTPFHFFIERIHIKVKFACRLYLQYFSNEESRKTKEIRIDQKNSMYRIDEEINYRNINANPSTNSDEGALVIYVKLVSSKGLTFTAGVAEISSSELIRFPQCFTLKLTKSQDFDSYCQCRRIQTLYTHNEQRGGVNQNMDQLKTIISTLKSKVSNLEQEQETLKASRQLQFLKNESEKDQTPKSILNSYTEYRSGDRRNKKQQNSDEFRHRQKELLQKIQDLESELHKNCVLFDKQKEIIFLLECKQREALEEKTHLKSQIKVIEIDVEDKRQKIRQLEGEKLKLLMSSLQSQKEMTALKQRIGSAMEKAYERIKIMLHQKNNNIVKEYVDKSLLGEKCKDPFRNQLSKITKKNGNVRSKDQRSKQIKEGQDYSKVAFSAVRGLMNKQVDQGWLEQSYGYRDMNPSSVLSNTLNDMSISDINGKIKEVSLLNSDLFLKPTESEPIIRSSSSNSKQFIQEINKSMNKLENMISLKTNKMIQSFIDTLQKNKNAGKDGSSAQESLLGYLEQLENGFQRQLGVLGQKQRIMVYYEQVIEQLNQTLSEKQNLVVQLEEQLFKLEEERDHIKSQLHESNYAHALKEEQYLNKIHILEYGRNMPDSSNSASPTNKPLARRKEHRKVHSGHEEELIQYKEHLRMMEIDLLHERDEKSKLLSSLHSKQLQLQDILIQKRRLEFSIKLRDRMASLNQSIELSVQDEAEAHIAPKNNDKFTQQSIGNEHDYLNILISQQ